MEEARLAAWIFLPFLFLGSMYSMMEASRGWSGSRFYYFGLGLSLYPIIFGMFQEEGVTKLSLGFLTVLAIHSSAGPFILARADRPWMGDLVVGSIVYLLAGGALSLFAFYGNFPLGIGFLATFLAFMAFNFWTLFWGKNL